MDDEQRDVVDTLATVNNSSGMEVEEGDEAGDLDNSIVEDVSCSNTSTASHAGRESGTDTIAQPSALSNNIRRSARQQHPPDRLVYPSAASSVTVKAERAQGPKRTAKTHAEAAGPTDTECAELSDSAWTSSSSSSAASSSERSTPCQQHKKRKKHRHGDAQHSALCSDGSGEAEQVAALVVKLKEGHARRLKELDMESVPSRWCCSWGVTSWEAAGAGWMSTAMVSILSSFSSAPPRSSCSPSQRRCSWWDTTFDRRSQLD